MIEDLKTYFKKIYHEKPTKVYSAPARINLIGEHLDYNGGLVLPCGIDRRIYAAISMTNDKKISLSSTISEESLTIDLDEIRPNEIKGWENYPLGVFYILKKRGIDLKCGLKIAFASEIPLASGLSSSAAILNLTGFIASNIYGLNLSDEDIALLSYEVENKFIGLKSGIMDEYAIALARENKCLLLDCNSRKYEHHEIKLNKYSLVVIVSNVHRELVKSPYNDRVDECQKSLSILKKNHDISCLCDLKENELEMIKDELNNELLFKRTRHVVTENERVKKFLIALKNNDEDQLAALLNASQESLSKDYEVSGQYLDYIHEKSLSFGALGERMTGAGFGGSAIALIKKDDFVSFKDKLEKAYFDKFKIKPDIFLCNISDGLKVE